MLRIGYKRLSFLAIFIRFYDFDYCSSAGLSVLIELPKRERFCERFHSFCSRKNEILKLQFHFLPFLANP